MTIEREKNDAVIFLVGETTATFLECLSRNDSFKKLDLETTSKVALEIILFLLHFCDREIFTLLGSEKRKIVMDDVLENTFKFLEKYDENILIKHLGEKTNANIGQYFMYLSQMALSVGFREVYNERQVEYAAYKKLYPEKDESPKGTLVWEFSKKIIALVNGTPDLMLIMLPLTGDSIKVCIKTLKTIF